MTDSNSPLNPTDAAALLRRFACDTQISDSDLLLVASYISACAPIPTLTDNQNQRRYLA